MAKKLEGAVPILSTPFDEGDQIDEDGLKREVDYLLRAGANAIGFGLGSEIYTLTDPERERSLRIVVEQVAGRVPVIASTGAHSTRAAIVLSKTAQECGADAVMLTPPYVVKPDAEGVFSYYQAVSNALDIPIVVQDAPTMTGVPMSAQFLARLVNELENVRYIKVEALPPGPKITEVLALTGGKAIVLGGQGGKHFLQELGRGSQGTMPGAAFIEVFVEVWHSYRAGDLRRAYQVFNRHLPILNFMAQSSDIFLASQKEILKMGGVLRTARLRSPARPLDETTRSELLTLMEGLDTGL